MTSSEPTIVIGRISLSARSFAASAKPACPAPTITNLPVTPYSSCLLRSSSEYHQIGDPRGIAATPHRQQRDMVKQDAITGFAWHTAHPKAESTPKIQSDAGFFGEIAADGSNFNEPFQNASGEEEYSHILRSKK